MTTDHDDQHSRIGRHRTGADVATSDGFEPREYDARRTGTADDRPLRDRSPTLGFAALGALCFVVGLAVADGRGVLFALAGVGGFAAVLAHAAAPERTVDERDGRRVYETGAANVGLLLDAVGRTDDERYVPAADGSSVRLCVPFDADTVQVDRVPIRPAVEGNGAELVLEPLGTPFVDELDRTLEAGLPDRPEPLVERLTAALTHRFEFAARADPFVDEDARRVDVAVSERAFGPLGGFDHPVVSVLGTGLAAGLDRPVTVTVSAERAGGERLVTCRWEPPNAADDDG